MLRIPKHMNNLLNPLVKTALAVMVLLGVFLLVQINHVWNTATTTNTVSFSGQGKVMAKPDIAMVSATVLTQSSNSKTAQDQNTAKSNAVTEYLKGQGIEEKDIKTTGYNIYPQYSYPAYGGQGTITGYQVTQSFQVKVRDLGKLSTILGGLVSAGANQVDNLGLQVENPETLKAQARQMAIDDAKKKAQELKGQVGISLGRIVNFAEGYNGYPVPMYGAAMDARGMGGGGGPVISGGENEIIVDVTITYQIK